MVCPIGLRSIRNRNIKSARNRGRPVTVNLAVSLSVRCGEAIGPINSQRELIVDQGFEITFAEETQRMGTKVQRDSCE